MPDTGSIKRVANALASHGLVASTKEGEFGAEDHDDWITVTILEPPEKRPAHAPLAFRPAVARSTIVSRSN